MVKEPYQKAILNHPFIDKLITIKKKKGFAYAKERLKVWLKIRALHFDLVIDYQNKPSSQQITLFSGARFRVGYNHERFNFVYNFKSIIKDDRYSGSMKYDILKPLGIKEEPYNLYFDIGEKNQRFIDNWLATNTYNPSQLICVSPGTPVSKRKWLLTNYAALCDLIQTETDFKVVLLWGPKELNDINSVKDAMKTTPIVAPPTNLNQAVALLKVCKLLLCNNCGLTHLSTTVKIPTLTFFGNTSPTVWCPGPAFNHFYLFHPEFDSQNDYSFGISPEEAFREVKRILSLNLTR